MKEIDIVVDVRTQEMAAQLFAATVLNSGACRSLDWPLIIKKMQQPLSSPWEPSDRTKVLESSMYEPWDYKQGYLSPESCFDDIDDSVLDNWATCTSGSGVDFYFSIANGVLEETLPMGVSKSRVKDMSFPVRIQIDFKRDSKQFSRDVLLAITSFVTDNDLDTGWSLYYATQASWSDTLEERDCDALKDLFVCFFVTSVPTAHGYKRATELY